MKIKVRYFASLREHLGEGADINIGDNLTIGELKQHLTGGDANHILLRQQVLNARNHDVVGDDVILNNDDEIGFFPPVTGG